MYNSAFNVYSYVDNIIV